MGLKERRTDFGWGFCRWQLGSFYCQNHECAVHLFRLGFVNEKLFVRQEHGESYMQRLLNLFPSKKAALSKSMLQPGLLKHSCPSQY